jgi:RNA polymerase sigma-70 factor, ECF subfamily
MTGEPPDALEAAIRAASESGRHDEAARLIIEHWGPEILGFLCAWVGDREVGREAFSMFCEDLCVGLPRFSFRCTARGWCYTLARNAGRRRAKLEGRHRARRTSLGTNTAADLAARAASATDAYLKTGFKDKFRELRERLPEEDRLLLILRADRNLAWRDLVVVLAESESGLSEEALVREATRLRKRFQMIKERLRELARSEGLIE